MPSAENSDMRHLEPETAVPVVILAGGLGTRISEETITKPKPLIEIGGRPIIWHIVKHYASYGLSRFWIAAGYKGEMLKRYFIDYATLVDDITVAIPSGAVKRLNGNTHDSWTVSVVDTGLETQTGGRIGRLASHLGDKRFMATYGDGLCDVDLRQLLDFHRSHGRLATVTAVRPPARFGGLIFQGDLVREFTEKPQIGDGWINGGFFVFEPEVLSYLKRDSTSLEYDCLETLAKDGQLAAFRHTSFWQCMDTLRDRRLLEALWESGEAPWKRW